MSGLKHVQISQVRVTSSVWASEFVARQSSWPAMLPLSTTTVSQGGEAVFDTLVDVLILPCGGVEAAL